jgi:hypothetical protein
MELTFNDFITLAASRFQFISIKDDNSATGVANHSSLA